MSEEEIATVAFSEILNLGACDLTTPVGASVECQSRGHDWAPVGVYINGLLTVPCRRKNCRIERQQVWREVEGPGLSIDDMKLDIEDDPLGGVAKVICREAAGKYDKLDLEPNDVAIDIGAHVGVVSIYLAKRYPGIRVYAFEPQPENYQRLCRNILANNVTGVVAIKKAVTSDGRVVELASNLSVNSGGASMLAGQGKNVIAQSTTLARIWTDYSLDQVKLLKIDAEGAEYEILEGAGACLDRVEYLRGEFHVNRQIELMGRSPEKLLAMCQRHIKAKKADVTFCRMGD